jgi:hypothetical protein
LCESALTDQRKYEQLNMNDLSLALMQVTDKLLRDHS